jgi:hypothetical protein
LGQDRALVQSDRAPVEGASESDHSGLMQQESNRRTRSLAVPNREFQGRPAAPVSLCAGEPQVILGERPAAWLAIREHKNNDHAADWEPRSRLEREARQSPLARRGTGQGIHQAFGSFFASVLCGHPASANCTKPNWFFGSGLAVSSQSLVPSRQIGGGATGPATGAARKAGLTAPPQEADSFPSGWTASASGQGTKSLAR